jgi:hypothetical protein
MKYDHASNDDGAALDFRARPPRRGDHAQHLGAGLPRSGRFNDQADNVPNQYY